MNIDLTPSWQTIEQKLVFERVIEKLRNAPVEKLLALDILLSNSAKEIQKENKIKISKN